MDFVLFNTDEVVTDNDGRFTVNVKINKGDNFLKAYSKDSAGNTSQDTKTYKIVFDNEPPDLEINSPQDNAEFFGSTQKSLTITGTTEPRSKVQVNDRLVIVGSSGNFSYNTQLSDGENNFTIKSTDEADNTTETSIKVSYTP